MCYGQVTVSGTVKSAKGEPLVGVNVYLENTYDGTITGPDGTFTFESDYEGEQILVVSYIGYVTQYIPLSGQTGPVHVRLKESITSLGAVTITAGSFIAGDKNRAAVMEPLDIYTTAGSLGDINGAIKTLPGTQPAADDGRLLVRGGEAYETKVYVDGLLAAKPFYSKVPDLPTRGRFAPSLFSGTVFSTGGYSAEYGQALSSVLILESTDVTLEEVTSLSLMSIGAELSNTWCRPNSSTSMGVNYTNMAPYYGMVHNQLDWEKPVEAAGINIIHCFKDKKGGIFKLFATGDYGIQTFNTYGNGAEKDFKIDNEGGNAYFNATYNTGLSDNIALHTGISGTFDDDYLLADVHKTNTLETSVEGRVSLAHHLGDGIKVSYGIADAFTHYNQDYRLQTNGFTWSGQINDHILSLFVEPEIQLSSRLAFRCGLRYEYSTYLQKASISPRLGLAWKTGKHSQLSAAYGQFFQNPENDYLKYTPELNFEKATHYILGFQIGDMHNRLLRAETYYKKYRQLLTINNREGQDYPSFSNNGHGFARGIDIFFRDRKTIKLTDYWVSYSYVDSKRKYKHYPVEATPDYIAKHTLSAVGKYFLGAINTQIGATWVMSSGRPYNVPGDTRFMSRKTPHYNSLSLNLSYLTNLWGNFTIVHFSLSNALGRDNVLGYRSVPASDSNQPDTLIPLKEDIRQFMFLGVFISIK
ncbi:TonB-dependent receptor [Marinilabiliaceae bacterium JC017]|nr:TonB-dependent receptor [Marinilabiliaceae bacterium JC017]